MAAITSAVALPSVAPAAPWGCSKGALRTQLRPNAFLPSSRVLGMRSNARRNVVAPTAQFREDDKKNPVQEAGEQLKSSVQQGIDGILGRTQQVGQEAGQKAQQAAEDVKQRTGGAWESAQDEAKGTAEDVKQRTGNALESAQEQAKETAEDVQHRGKGVLGEAQDRAQEVGERGQQAWGETQDKAEEASEKVRGQGQQALDGASKGVQQMSDEAAEGVQAEGGAAEGTQWKGGASGGGDDLAKEAGTENLHTAINGDVMGWTSSGRGVTAEQADKAGMSEGDLLAKKLTGRAEKGT